MAQTTGKRSTYAEKQEKMKNGSYKGNSPFYQNIPEFQFLRPLTSYPHLMEGGMRVASDYKKQLAAKSNEEEEAALS